MDYSTFIKRSPGELRPGLRAMTHIPLFAAAQGIAPRTKHEWNMCIVAYAHRLDAVFHVGRVSYAEYNGVVGVIVKSIVLNKEHATIPARKAAWIREELDILGVVYRMERTQGRAIKLCSVCKVQMTPEHIMCVDEAKEYMSRIYDHVGHTDISFGERATVNSGEYITLKSFVIYPITHALEHAAITAALPLPIAEAIIEQFFFTTCVTKPPRNI